MNRRTIDMAVRDILRTGDTPVLTVELNKAPAQSALTLDSDTGKLLKPYAMLIALPSGAWTSTFGLPEGQITLLYQVTHIGQREDQVEWMAAQTRARLTGRGDNGDFLTDLSAARVIVRNQSLLGAAQPTADGGLWEVIDRYDLGVMTS